MKEEENDELQKFTDLAAADKIRYQEEMENYSPSEDDDHEVTKKKIKAPTTKKSAAKKSATKKSAGKGSSKKINGYIHYCNETRESLKMENPNLDGKDITKKLAMNWKNLDVDEKQRWKDEAQELNE
jgi:hypothetical protein